MDSYVDRLRKHLNDILCEQPKDIMEALSSENLPDLESELTSLAHDDQELELVINGLSHLQSDTEIQEDEAFALEAIVLPRERPVIDIIKILFIGHLCHGST